MAHHAGLHIHACRVKIFRWGRVLERAVEGARAKIFETERRELFSGTDVYVEDCGELKSRSPKGHSCSGAAGLALIVLVGGSWRGYATSGPTSTSTNESTCGISGYSCQG